MYDDDYYPDSGISSWYGERRPGPGETVHLCPECRDLMSEVVSLARRLPDPRPEPDWSRALRWLDGICGGRQAVLALDAAPLTEEGLDLPVGVPAGHRQRLESCATLLDATARRFLDEEAAVALRRALLRLYACEPAVVTGARSAALLTLGVVWAVGRANGWMYPRGTLTEKDLKPYLNATGTAATIGGRVVDGLVGPYRWQTTSRPWSFGGQSRDLEPLGHLDLLVSGTRRQLLEVRDRALADQEAEQRAA